MEWKDKRTFGGELGLKKKIDFQDVLRLAVCSEVRMNIILSLNEEKKALGELRDDVNISSTTAIHALRELEKGELVFQDSDRNYLLTNTGRIAALNLIDFSNSADVLKKHKKFWLEHDLSGIPEHMVKKIGWLRDSFLATDTETEIFKVHSNFINLLKDANEIRGVSSIFVPEYASLFEELILEKKIDVRLILKRDVAEKIDEEILNKITTCRDHKFKLYLMEENIKAAFTVTDYFLSFGLYRLDGTYDYSNDLISYGKEAIAWGKELYDHYVKLSERVI